MSSILKSFFKKAEKKQGQGQGQGSALDEQLRRAEDALPSGSLHSCSSEESAFSSDSSRRLSARKASLSSLALAQTERERESGSRPGSGKIERKSSINFSGLDSVLLNIPEIVIKTDSPADSPRVESGKQTPTSAKRHSQTVGTPSRAQQTLDLHLRKLGLLHRCLREEIAEARLLLQSTAASATMTTSEAPAIDRERSDSSGAPESASSTDSQEQQLEQQQSETNATIALFQPLVQSLSARGLCVSAHTLYCVCVEVAQRVLDHLLGGLEGGAKDLSVVSKRLHKLAGALTDADSALCATRACVRSVLSAALGDDDDEESDGEGERAIAGISAEDMVRLESATAQLLVSVSLDVAKMASKQLPGPLCVEDLDARVSRALYGHDFEIDDVVVLPAKLNVSVIIERSKADTSVVIEE